MVLGDRFVGSLGGSPPTVLVTAADCVVGNALLRALTGRARLLAADSAPDAAGLYLVPAANRVRLPGLDDPGYARCVLEAALGLRAEVVFPVSPRDQALLAPLARDFAAAGVSVVSDDVDALDTCRDLLRLTDLCSTSAAVPATVHLTADVRASDLQALGERVVIRGRGSGHRFGAIDTTDHRRLALLPRDGGLVAQEYLPGPDCDIDVVVGPDGSPAIAVPHVRRRRDGGRLMADRTLLDPEMQAFAADVVEALGLRWVASVRARRTVRGHPALVSVTPGFTESISLGLAAGVNLPALVLARAQGATPPKAAFDEVEGPATRVPVVVSLDRHRRTSATRQRRTG